ncbi:MAG: aminomethyl-transferring glycine dehydrogenase [Bacteroidia bacterium]|nr:aminomethyl-transferring glycine dehydrogenase [Bacteroidia bacterium]MDW8159451.1 aminomethyl-transferring glycine dehydrogenase [Bacteroidia bacterium]
MPISISLEAPDAFVDRHIGTRDKDSLQKMLAILNVNSLEQLIEETVPPRIRMKDELNIGEPTTEYEILQKLRHIASKNRVYQSFIGMGYSGCVTPSVIRRNIFENPGWYTQYTPYQAEIAQGRLEALMNFQTMICDLTAMEIANASLLDEGTAAAEAMLMLFHSSRGKNFSQKFLVSRHLHPQNIAVLQTRAEPLNIEIEFFEELEGLPAGDYFGLIVQYPTTEGALYDYRELVEQAHSRGILVVFATDILGLTLYTPPGELGADVVVGSSQRFGIPLGFGGPHAAFFATKNDFKRHIPGRLVGASIDSNGKTGYRLALQTREQHIRREKATSNICTAQVLLAVMASMYAVYHGPERLKKIALRIHGFARILNDALQKLGYTQLNQYFFDTLCIDISDKPQNLRNEIEKRALAAKMNLRYYPNVPKIGIALDETTQLSHIQQLVDIFARAVGKESISIATENLSLELDWSQSLIRTSTYLAHPIFNRYHTETELMRYIRKLESRDLSLTTSMIPLGSCTMKLNASTEMFPVSYPEFSQIHPFAPAAQVAGYKQIFAELSEALSKITGFPGISLQPNSGAQGEYTGLMVIRSYFKDKKQGHRNVVLIPTSAHGTNPASAVMAGMQVVLVKCDEQGNIDITDLEEKAVLHKDRLAALMVTYPSTHGVFEENIKDICNIIHQNGGMVYMDGANMNAQVGLTQPALIGADVCHLNLHKTFCIPHGGGGPGMGPIGVVEKLKPYLPGHSVVPIGGKKSMSAVSSAPWGSASILLISYIYIQLMGDSGLKAATEHAILNANYIKTRLEPYYPILYKGKNGRVAHELIIDLRGFKHTANVEVEDVAKRLIDYGYHAPTISFPVPGTMMVEPTESESLAELDRFCAAMIAIRGEIQEILDGKADKNNNVLKNAPHSIELIDKENWDFPYSRAKAFFPAPWLKDFKFWAPVGRIDNAYGDRHLVCVCPPIESYAAQELVTT